MQIHKDYITDKKGCPKAVVIPIQDYLRISDLLGLDLDSEAVEDLRTARRDRKSGKKSAYMDMESI